MALTEVTSSNQMYLGNQKINFAYLGSKNAIISNTPQIVPLEVQWLIVGGGSSGASTNGLNGGVGGPGGTWLTGSFGFTPLYSSASVNVTPGRTGGGYPPFIGVQTASPSSISITGSLLYSSNAGGNGGNGGVYGSSLCSAGAAGYVWLNGTAYAAGGGGGSAQPYSYQCGDGGPAGTPGMGGTGGSWPSGGGGRGVDGVAIFRYLGTTTRATGGTVTTDGTYTYHTFGSGSGTFTIT